jgi:hypothetical protein
MKNIDCDYMVFESYECCHPKIAKGWRRGIFRPKCIEVKDQYAECKYRDSHWDREKKKNDLL